MPTQLSKFFIDAACTEYTHPWTESCVSATAGLGLHAVQECIRIYSTVYFVTLLMKRKVPSKDDLERTVLGILQSTAFLSWHAFSFPLLTCSLRKLLGNFNVLSVSFIPAFLASLMAIMIERPSRRPLLCLYVSNIATETLFRMGVWRGYWNPVSHGNVYIFAASTAMLLYFFRSSDCPKKDSVFRIIKFVASPYEDPQYLQNKISSDESNSRGTSSSRSKEPPRKNRFVRKKSSFNLIWEALKVYQNIITWIKSFSRHSTCPHPHSCAHFILEGATKLFGIGLGAQLALKLVFQLQKFIAQPRLIKSTIFKKENANLALFLGGFTGIYRLMACSLRKIFDKDSKFHAIPAGLLAGTAFVMFPNNTVALYVMWKSLQILWNRGVETGNLPEVKWFTILLYSFSTAVLFHAAIVEPQNLRSSYWKFLCNLSGGRIASMNRVPLDGFGLKSSEHLKDVLKQNKMTLRNSYSF